MKTRFRRVPNHPALVVAPNGAEFYDLESMADRKTQFTLDGDTLTVLWAPNAPYARLVTYHRLRSALRASCNHFVYQGNVYARVSSTLTKGVWR